MYSEERCPCCTGRAFERFLGIVAPFIASYILHQRPGPTALLECEQCRFRFFERRFTDSETDALYAGYRGEKYFAQRHRAEPWYTKNLNDAIGSNEAEIQTRKGLAGDFIRSHVDVGGIENVLDYGGDHGQFIPDGVGAARFVFDISGKETVAGVERISQDGLARTAFDLIMLCHVLEHVSDPAAMLLELRKIAGAKPVLYFIEVPFERYALPFSRDSAALRAYLELLTRLPTPVVTLLDFYSTLARVKMAVVPPLGFPKLHEHINFYEPRSLTALLERCGYDVIACRVATEAKTTVGFQGTILCLARNRV